MTQPVKRPRVAAEAPMTMAKVIASLNTILENSHCVGCGATLAECKKGWPMSEGNALVTEPAGVLGLCCGRQCFHAPSKVEVAMLRDRVVRSVVLEAVDQKIGEAVRS